MAKFWKQLAQALPGTVEGFYKGRKMTQDAEQQKLENMYRQQKMLQDAQSIELDRSYKNKQMEKWDAENAPADFSWAAGNKELSGLFPQGTDLTRISRTDPRFSAAQKILERDPLDREYKRSQIAQNEAQTKKTMGEIPMDPAVLENLRAKSKYMLSQADALRTTDPRKAAYLDKQIQLMDLKIKDAENKPAKEYKKEQYDAGGFANRLRQAEDVFSGLEKSGFDRTSYKSAAQGYAPGMLQSGDFKSQDQAERNFINATLRRESGASISPTEYSSAEQQYFPRPGDTPEVLAQKKANRQQVFETMKAAAGGAYEQIPYISPSDARAQAAAKKKSSPPPTSGGPSVGEIVDGYKYIGGDPGNPRSWSKP